MFATREFDLGTVITAATGIMVARDEDFGVVYEFFEYITGGPVWTHQLPRLFDECKEGLYEQFPWMREIVFPDDLGPENYIEWLDGQAEIYGATLQVKPLDPSHFQVIEPIQELIDMKNPDATIIVAHLD